MMMSFEHVTPRRLTAAALLFAALAAAPAARAATAEERTAAKDQLTQAQTLKKAGQAADALPHFEESARLDPKLTTLMELAECAEQAGKLVEAQTHWAAARDMAKHDEKPQSRARAEERLAAVEKRVPHLTLQLAVNAPAGARVFRDDAAVDASALGTPQALNPGDHLVVVKLAGHDDAKYPVKLAEGDNQTLPLAEGPATAVAAPPPPPPKVVAPPPPPPQAEVSTSSGSGQRTIGIIAGAAGIVGVGIGGVLWNVGYRNGNSLGPTADNQVLTGEICVIGGGALLVTGIVLFVTAPSGEAAKTGRLPIAPTLAFDNGRTMLGAVGRF